MLWIGLILLIVGLLLRALVDDATIKQIGYVMVIIGAILLILAVVLIALGSGGLHLPSVRVG